jgi:hypothetical protein
MITKQLSNLKLNLMLQNGDAYYLIGATRGRQTHYDGPHMGREHVLRALEQRRASGPQPDRWFVFIVCEVKGV